jgi:hypothetical protein
MSLLDTVFIDSDARMSRIIGDPYQAGFRIIRTWPEGHANYADTKIIALNDCTRVTDPKVDKQTYTGTFVVSEIQPTEGADRRPTISQTLTKIKKISDTASLGPSIDGAKSEVLNPFAVRSGTGDYRTRQWLYLDPNDEQEAIGLNPVGDTGYTLIDKDFRHSSDRTGSMSALYKKPTWGNDTGVFTKINIENEGGYGERITKSATGVPVDDAVVLLRDMASTDSLLSASYVERGNGEGVVRKTEHSGDSVAIETAYYNGYSKVGPRRVKTWYAVPLSNVDTTYVVAKGYLGDTSDTNFVHRYHKNLPAPDGYSTITAEAWRPFADTNDQGGGGGITETDSVTEYFNRYTNRYSPSIRERQRITYVKHKKYFAIRTFGTNWITEGEGDAGQSFNKRLLPGSQTVNSKYGGYDAIKIRFDTWSDWEFVDEKQPLP